VNQRVVYLLVASAFSFGCEGGGGGGAVPIAELGNELGAIVCPKMVECCTQMELEDELLGASNETECEAFYAGFLGQLLVPVLEDSVAAGRLVYDGEAMRTCLDAYAAIDCADLPAALHAGGPGGCTDPFMGQVALGGMCANDVDCQSNLCDGGSTDFDGNITYGTCAEVPAIGQACVDGDCGAGAFCDYASAQTCQAQLADGASCGADGDCASGGCNGRMNGQPGTCGPRMACDGM
jgi:hypothetical protein